MQHANKHYFIFECEDCKTVLEISIEDKDDIDDVMNNQITLDCPCGGICRPLFN